MQDEYSADEGVRLLSGCDSGEVRVASGRLLLWAGYRGHVIILSCICRSFIATSAGRANA